MELNKDVLERAIGDAKTGRQAAYSLLLNTYWTRIYGFLLKRTHDEYMAEEITIQTFSRAFDKLELYDDRYAFSTWLTTIAKNLHIDLLRNEKSASQNYNPKEKEQRLEGVPDENPTAEEVLINEQDQTELLGHVKKLKAPYRDVIYQRYFEEQSYREIAESLNEPMNNIKIRLLRARRLLAQLIYSST